VVCNICFREACEPDCVDCAEWARESRAMLAQFARKPKPSAKVRKARSTGDFEAVEEPYTGRFRLQFGSGRCR
jgi:hypothetical protein